jgi:hypothetical protein
MDVDRDDGNNSIKLIQNSKDNVVQFKHMTLRAKLEYFATFYRDWATIHGHSDQKMYDATLIYDGFYFFQYYIGMLYLLQENASSELKQTYPVRFTRIANHCETKHLLISKIHNARAMLFGIEDDVRRFCAIQLAQLYPLNQKFDVCDGTSMMSASKLVSLYMKCFSEYMLMPKISWFAIKMGLADDV